MNKIIQSKERNKKIIFIAVICILIIGIVGLLVFNTIDNSSAKLDNKGNTASKISNNVKEKDKQNEKEDFSSGRNRLYRLTHHSRIAERRI